MHPGHPMLNFTQQPHTMRILLLLAFSTVVSFAQPPAPFNHGRTRCYYGGMSFSVDSKTLYHTHVYQKDTLSAIAGKIAITSWSNNAWSAAVFPVFTGGNESYPVIDNNRLYFSSDAPLPNRSDSRDQNIWYVERTPSGWNTATPATQLNSLQNDRLAFIDSERNFYLVNNLNGHYDISVVKQTLSGWDDPQPMAVWNTPGDEEYVSVYTFFGVAFIQQTNGGNTTEIMMSSFENGTWTVPVPLNYAQKSTQLPYVQRWPQLSPDLSTMYLVNHGIIWQQPAGSVFDQNSKTVEKFAYKPLRAKPLSPGEPELIGGMLLKTNNGISFTPDGKTVYLSRYTNERDTTGSRFIKIFSSDLNKEGWTKPQPATFNKQGVPFEYHPVVGSEGTKIFFNSRAPIPASRSKYESRNNIWLVEKQEGGWSEPRVIQTLVTDAYDDYSSPAADGTLYFRSDRPGGSGGGDIYKSEYLDGEYQAPENLQELNSSFNENDLCIDPEERFIIFNRYFERTNNLKFFLSVRTKTGGWTKPRELTQLERSYDYELTPTLSHDGKYFYYEVNSNILRVETKSLFSREELKMIAGM
jgi:hypothetical protein